MCRTVDCYPVPNLILNNQHAKFFKLFTKVFNIETYQTIIQFYICAVIEYLQGTIYIDFQCSCQPLRLCLFLFAKQII